MKLHLKLWRRSAVLLLAASTLYSKNGYAQTTGDDTVTLSEFTVSAEADRGYAPSETMTGTRVATQIKDLPFNVSVITSEFFEDFAFFEINDNVSGYISSFSGLDQGGGFTLRGLTSTYQLRDGFFRLGRYGSSNIDRIEVIKGPSAAIYGQSSPTGIVNIISKRPKKKPAETLRLSAGSYDTLRENIETTGPIGTSGKDFYLFSAQNYERTFREPFAAQHNKELFLAVQHEFKDGSTFLAQAETFLSVRHSPNAALPIIIDNTVTPNRALGYDTRFATINQGGPTNNELTRGMTALTGTYEKRFNRVWSTRVSGNYYRARRWDTGVPSGNTVTTAGVLTRGATLGKGRIVEDGGGIQADALAHYTMFDHKVENRDLLTVDINDYFRYDPSYQATGPDATAWSANRNLVIGQAPVYYTAPFDYANSKLTRKNKNRTLIYGGLFRHQSAFFKGRLLTYAGVRVDHVIFNLRDLLNSRQAHFTADATTPNLGLNFKVRPNLATYVNYSKSFNPAGQTANAANIVPNQTGYGYDYGIKASFFDEKLNFTLGGYYIVRENVTVDDLDPDTGLTIKRAEGTQLYRGEEFDGNWRVTEDFTIGGNVGHSDARTVNLGYKYMSIGRSPSNATPLNVGFYSKYVFRHALKGLSANLGVVYRGPTPTEAPDAGDTYNTGSGKDGKFVSSTGQWAIKVPGWTVWNLGIRYNLRTDWLTKFSHTIALNVNNLFDKRYLNGRGLGENRSFYATYTLSH